MLLYIEIPACTRCIGSKINHSIHLNLITLICFLLMYYCKFLGKLFKWLLILMLTNTFWRAYKTGLVFLNW